MRVTGGLARGIPLSCPKGKDVRPATDKMREAVFSSLGCVEDLVCLDLFAGVGSYGLEALSRGAKEVSFVEKDRKAILALDENIKAVCKSAQIDTLRTQTFSQDVFSWLKHFSNISVDLVFVDPPYPIIEKKGALILDLLTQVVGRETIIVFEMPERTTLSHQKLEYIKTIGSKGIDSPTVNIYKRI